MRVFVAIGCLGSLACAPAYPPHAPEVDSGGVEIRLDVGPIVAQPDTGTTTQIDSGSPSDSSVDPAQDGAPTADAWAASDGGGGGSFDSGGGLLDDAELDFNDAAAP